MDRGIYNIPLKLLMELAHTIFNSYLLFANDQGCLHPSNFDLIKQTSDNYWVSKIALREVSKFTN